MEVITQSHNHAWQHMGLILVRNDKIPMNFLGTKTSRCIRSLLFSQKMASCITFLWYVLAAGYGLSYKNKEMMHYSDTLFSKQEKRKNNNNNNNR